MFYWTPSICTEDNLDKVVAGKKQKTNGIAIGGGSAILGFLKSKEPGEVTCISPFWSELRIMFQWTALWVAGEAGQLAQPVVEVGAEPGPGRIVWGTL